MITKALPVAVLALSLGGCGAVCQGPGCADTYSNGRAAFLTWTPETARRLAPWDDATIRLAGREDEGTDWTVIPAAPGEVWVAMPQSNQVVRTGLDKSRLQPSFTITGAGGFGTSILRIDVDGDGQRDLVIGAPEADFGAGAVYGFTNLPPGRTGTLTQDQATFTIRGTRPSDRLGSAIYACADLTGDDRPEWVITAPWLSAPSRDIEIADLAGGLFVALSENLTDPSGELDPWSLGPTWWGDGVGDAAGRSVSCRHDLTGDRRADVAIGAPFAGDNGQVYIVQPDAIAALAGQPNLPDSGALGGLPGILPLTSALPDAWFGASLTTMELDDEAPLDLVIGAPGAHEGEGRVEVFRGASLIERDPVAWRIIRNQATRNEPDHFGHRLFSRDLDGDTIEDLLVGVPDWYGGGNAYDAGRVFIWNGASSNVWPPTFTVDSADWRVEGTQPFERVGRRIDVFDADGDGTRELVLSTRAIPTN